MAPTGALSLETGLPCVIVRKKPKSLGTASAIEGRLVPGEAVLLVEDIVSTGGEALAAVAKLRAAGADVVGVLAVVDRGSGGAEAIAAAGLPFDALFRIDELLARGVGPA